jgi:hypothetical protein
MSRITRIAAASQPEERLHDRIAAMPQSGLAASATIRGIRGQN